MAPDSWIAMGIWNLNRESPRQVSLSKRFVHLWSNASPHSLHKAAGMSPERAGAAVLASSQALLHQISTTGYHKYCNPCACVAIWLDLIAIWLFHPVTPRQSKKDFWQWNQGILLLNKSRGHTYSAKMHWSTWAGPSNHNNVLLMLAFKFGTIVVSH